MHIFEIVVPGDRLERIGPNPRWMWDMEDMLGSMLDLFFEANLALNLFEQSRRTTGKDLSAQACHARSSRRSELEWVVEQERGPSSDFSKKDIRLEADVRLKREEWAAGQMPSKLENRIPSLYAKAFLSALDGFEKLLWTISKIDGRPDAIADLHKKLKTAFPDLRGVRNSVQHHEKRVRSLDRDYEPLDLQPLPNEMAPSGLKVLALNNLHGSKLRTTMDCGNYGEVDVSVESMEKLKEILQEVINAFVWTGPKCHLPS